MCEIFSDIPEIQTDYIDYTDKINYVGANLSIN